jgi:monoterpene epsilon-lactone hydrolase
MTTKNEQQLANKPSKQVEEVGKWWLTMSAAAAELTSLDEVRDFGENWEALTAEPRGVDYIETDANGVPAMWAVPKGCAEDRVILCLHGGGFFSGSMYTHRKLYGHFAKAIGCRALIPHYRRSPEHVHPAQVNDVVAAY